MTQGIYAITNKLNGKAYVGSSTDIEKRFNVHKALLKSGSHQSSKLQEDWNQYGADSFELVVLKEIEESINLVQIEQEFIDQYKAWQKDYNIRKAFVEPVEKEEVIPPPAFVDGIKSRAAIYRDCYLKRTAHIERRLCPCGKHRIYSKLRDICVACWLKTDEGREYMRLKQIETRNKRKSDEN